MSFDPNIERKQMNWCKECQTPLDLEQQLKQLNGEKDFCHECYCADCSHPMEQHKDADCETCLECNIDKGDRLHDVAKETDPDAPDPMDHEESPVFQQEYGRTDARSSIYH